MAGDNRPLPAARSMAHRPRVDVCLTVRTDPASTNTHTFPHFLSSYTSGSKMSAFSFSDTNIGRIYKQRAHIVFSYFEMKTMKDGETGLPAENLPCKVELRTIFIEVA